MIKNINGPTINTYVSEESFVTIFLNSFPHKELSGLATFNVR